MAVVAPPPHRTKLDVWGPSDHPGTSSAAASSYKYQRAVAAAASSPEPMTDIMSYQYPPPPPQNGAGDMDLPPSGGGYMSGYSVPPPSSNMERSMSTPNVRPGQTPPDHAAAAAALQADKRRNKLGYHRTSVACGHCRRRKIRCIPSPADMQGRCVNCIRLKKDCSFFPVDQQQVPDPRAVPGKPGPPQRSSTGGNGPAPKLASASSSPAISQGHPSDHHQSYSQMPPISSMAPPSTKPGGDRYSPESKGRYDFGQPISNANWMSTDASPSSTKPGELNTSWRSYAPHESPVGTPSFSPYTPHAPPASASWGTPAGGDSASREEMWAGQSSYPPPPRSMSYSGESSHHHGVGGHHGSQYPPISSGGGSGRSYDAIAGSRKSSSMSEMYPPPIATTIEGGPGGAPGGPMDPHSSLSAGSAPPSNYGSWGPQPSYPYSAKPAESPYASTWSYSENGATEEPTSVSEAAPSGGSIYYSSR